MSGSREDGPPAIAVSPHNLERSRGDGQEAVKMVAGAWQGGRSGQFSTSFRTSPRMTAFGAVLGCVRGRVRRKRQPVVGLFSSRSHECSVPNWSWSVSIPCTSHHLHTLRASCL
jgi:hypothetical protein